MANKEHLAILVREPMEGRNPDRLLDEISVGWIAEVMRQMLDSCASRAQ